jgi:glycogen(starch) synthase
MSLKIAMTTKRYFPEIGGVPVFARAMANALADHGVSVRLLTPTLSPVVDREQERFDLIRTKKVRDLIDLSRWCDVLIQVELSIKHLWPFVLRGRHCFITHHTHYVAKGKRPDPVRLIQGWLASHCFPISVSEMIRQSWGGAGVVIDNPYCESVFKTDEANPDRKHDLLFVGRLGREKGLHVLLDALSVLSKEGVKPSLVVVGDNPEASGPNLDYWQQYAVGVGVSDQVTFVGMLNAEETAEKMRRSRILVILSVWDEPFGIVALEGLACGCRVVTSGTGGLKVACGDHACYFESGDHSDLAKKLEQELGTGWGFDTFTDDLKAHLDAHTTRNIGRRYLDYIEASLR